MSAAVFFSGRSLLALAVTWHFIHSLLALAVIWHFIHSSQLFCAAFLPAGAENAVQAYTDYSRIAAVGQSAWLLVSVMVSDIMVINRVWEVWATNGYWYFRRCP
ncbi:hypothetical protein B0H13DRAFT_752703 [Mycena leptocephala]|nr:hypothetical protein B0H13DRAFT_752703 [Mycena leptocephala]